MEILFRDLAKRPRTEILPLELLERSCTEILPVDLLWRSCPETWWREQRSCSEILWQRICPGDLAHELLQRSSQRELAESNLASLLPGTTLTEHNAFNTRVALVLHDFGSFLPFPLESELHTVWFLLPGYFCHQGVLSWPSPQRHSYRASPSRPTHPVGPPPSLRGSPAGASRGVSSPQLAPHAGERGVQGSLSIYEYKYICI